MRKWVPVTLPAGVESGGCLNASDTGTSRIYYSPPKDAVTGLSDQCPTGYGLWVSEDEGGSWLQVDTHHLFRSVLLHNDGALYASEREPSDKSNVDLEAALFGGRAVVSADGGKTWQKTEGSDAIPGILSLTGCSANPAHVCAVGQGIRSYKMEYAPELKRWNVTPSFMAINDASPDEYLAVKVGSGTSPCCYMLRANLENYYENSFGQSLQRSGIMTTVARERYDSGLEGPIVVDVFMELLPVDPPKLELAIPDIDATPSCWGLKYVDPEGRKDRVSPGAGSPFLGFTDATPGTATPTVPATGSVHVLRARQKYHRRVDLRALAAFDKPGIYKVALIFDNSTIAKRSPEEWTGFVSSEPFEVAISQ
jgi:hypothetical protein